jgi:nickel/cobalt exporter
MYGLYHGFAAPANWNAIDLTYGAGVYVLVHSFQDYLSHGQGWLFIPAAILLGALHGLEPGHSKTMMAAFIISIRGTVKQAVLLGLSAAFSHTLIIWVLAAIGLHYAGKLDVEGLEPWFQLVAGVIIMGMAFWVFTRVRREQRAAAAHEHQHGPHGGTMLDTGHGLLEVSVFETGVTPRFRLYFFDGKLSPVNPPAGEHVTLETLRPDGTRETFLFKHCGDYLEAMTNLPEPHEFKAKLILAHGGHSHTYETQFTEGHHHHHDHDAAGESSAEFQDAHERAHAEELQSRFAGQSVTTKQIVLFGLTGGLMPCPAAFSILLVCLQIKQFTLGFAIVLAFSVGLALTLVTVGTVAALSVREASRHFSGFAKLARRLPYASVGLMGLIGIVLVVIGLKHLLH